MNKNTRLLVTLLFAVLIVLAVTVTRSYVVFPETAIRDKQADIAAIVAGSDSGYIIFKSESGDLGIAQSGRISAAPEWKELSFAGEGRCIAGKKIGGSMRFGCIDYDGNITVPMVYEKIRELKAGDRKFYSAQCAEDGSYVLYSEDFVPCLGRPWKSCTAEGSDITVSDGTGRYTYTPSSGGLLFKSAEVTGSMQDCEYELKIYSRVLLSKLSVPMISRMLSDTEKYLEYAFTGNKEDFSEAISESRTAFQILFGSDERITARRLTGISNMFIYAVTNEGGEQEFEVSVTVDAEVTDTMGDGVTAQLKDRSRATVTFKGGSDTSLRMVSGSFDKKTPDRPEPEEKPEENQ